MFTVEIETVDISCRIRRKKKINFSETAFASVFRCKGEEPSSETLWVL